jgi:hypothetical protein
MFIAALAVHDGSTLDWDAAEAAITALSEERRADLTDHLGWGSDEDSEPNETTNELLRQAVRDLRAALDGSGQLRRELDHTRIGHWTIYLTGGLSTGDPPTDLYEVFSALEVTGLDTAIGFSWPATDYPEDTGREGGGLM